MTNLAVLVKEGMDLSTIRVIRVRDGRVNEHLSEGHVMTVSAFSEGGLTCHYVDGRNKNRTEWFHLRELLACIPIQELPDDIKST